MKSYDYQVIKIDENTYRLEEYAKTHSYLLLGNEKAMLIDTGCGCGNLYETVRKITDLKLIVVNSHGHMDHIGANYQFDLVWIAKEDEKLMWGSSTSEAKEIGVKSYLLSMDPMFDTNELNHIIRSPQVKKVAHLQDGIKFELGGRTVEAIATPGHTTGSYCFLDSKNRQLFTADTICDISVLLFLEQSESVETFYQSVEKLYNRKNEYSIIYPGHHTVPLEVTFIEDYKACAKQIMQHTLVGELHEESIGTGLKAVYNRIGIVYKEEWILNRDRNHVRNQDRCYDRE